MSTPQFPSSPSQAQESVMPIAIVGLSGRYPGEASSPEKLWDLISKGRSAMTEIPKDRFNIDSFYHPYNERSGTLNARGGHYMNRDVDAFDAPFFSILPAEAKALDPQQRMALECAYEAFENAGISMGDLTGTDTSCYVGSFSKDYAEMVGADQEDLPLYHGVGTGTAILSNRISWFFDLHGPSISIDTACSSALVALHLGCQSLRTGESQASIVGGVNFMLLPGVMTNMSSLHFLSPDSRCHSFDDRANGYARGEGASFVVLKPLDKALRDHDMIRGVIRNTACGQDGNTPGITVPSGEAQEALIRKCYDEAGLNLSETKYAESHGTGTQQGDFREAGALSATLGKSRSVGDPLLVGSIKTNIGHLEGASGLAQVTKAIFALEKAELPPNLWYENPNPRIPMDEWNIKIVDKVTPWPGSDQRRISINSFGYGGTNAHCIIDDAYHYLHDRRLKGNHNTVNLYGASLALSPTSSIDSGIGLGSSTPSFDRLSALLKPLNHDYFGASTTPSSMRLVMWSSNEQSGIERIAKQYHQYLLDHVEKSEGKDEQSVLAKFARTLSTRRTNLPWKSFTVAASDKELCESMLSPPKAKRSAAKAPRLAFVFTGQGAQWFAMGRELCSHRLFQQSLEAAGAYLVELGCTWSLLAEFLRDEKTSNINAPSRSQPICTALQVALVDLLRSWGISPSAVVGHSSGEIAAAYAKGAITREAAWAISYHRGRLSENLPGFAPELKGAMLATGIGAEAVEPYLARVTDGEALVACKNSPSSTTISGDMTAVNQLEGMLKTDGHFARRLLVSTAYHSPHMRVIADLYHNSIRAYEPISEDDSSIKMFSSVTGEIIRSQDLRPSYWVSNMVNPVEFDAAVRALVQHTEGRRATKKPSVDIMVELGPHSALQGPVKQILKAVDGKFAEIQCLSVLRRGKDACQTSLETAGQLTQVGYKIDLAAVNQEVDNIGKDGFLVDLPAYAWNHANKYWAEPTVSKNYRFRKNPRTDLLGGMLPQATTLEPIYRNILKANEIPWVEHHKVQGTTLYPAAGMMIAAIESACLRADTTRAIEGYELKDVLIGKAIVIPQDDSGTETMLNIRPWRPASQDLASTWEEFKLFSRHEENWELNCTGLIQVRYASESSAIFTNEQEIKTQRYQNWFNAIEETCTKDIDVPTHYSSVAGIGYNFTGPFQTLNSIKKGHYKSRCELKIPDTKSMMPYEHEYKHIIHPAVLDSVIQMGICAATPADEELHVAAVPTLIRSLFVSNDMPTAAGTLLQGCAAIENPGFENPEQTFVVLDDTRTKPLIVFEGLKSTALRHGELGFTQALNMRKLAAKFHWQEDLEKIDLDVLRKICASALSETAQIKAGVIGDIEHAAFVYMKRVLADVKPEEAQSFAPHFQQFYKLMQKTHAEVTEGINPHQKQQKDQDWLNGDADAEKELLARVAANSSDGAALVAHGEHLPSIMRGETLAIEVLMENNRLNDFYQYGLGNEQVYAQLATYVDILGHRNPDMKILEIGGGTGGCTLPILEVLGGKNGTSPRFSSYTFTDISTGFFEKASEKFKTWLPFMTFQKLDVEQDPSTWGLNLGDYDLIVAANVLHATVSMDKTLSNVHELMKPDAKLVMSEITNPQLRFHMIVGSFDGWWAGRNEGREWGPTLTKESWDAVLRRTGYSGIDVTLDDVPNSIDRAYSVIVSSASPREVENTVKDVVVVEPQELGHELELFSDALLKEIEASGAKIVRKTLQDAASVDVTDKSVIFTLDCAGSGTFLADIQAAEWDALKRCILDCSSSIWLTRGAAIDSGFPESNMINGMARCVRAENPALALTTLDLDPSRPFDTLSNIKNVKSVYDRSINAIGQRRPDWEYAIRDEKVFIPRLLPEKGLNDLISSFHADPKPEQAPFKQDGRHLELQAGTSGRLDTLRFADDEQYDLPLGSDEVELEVKAVGLNFKDVMVAMGQLQEKYLGLDCSGTVSRVGAGVKNVKVGDNVMTWTLGSFRTYARTPAAMAIPVPQGMSMATAASLPLVFCTAYYSLFDVGRLKKGDSVLIHCAAGGVGQAAIMLAQHVGATIIATVSSAEKKAILMEQYGIPESHILNSRDNSFADGVMRLTNQNGVNVVLNSLAGDLLRDTWKCVAWFGRFVEIGKKDIESNTGLEMAPFARNCTYSSVDLVGLWRHDLGTSARVFTDVMNLFGENVIQPIHPTTSMPFSHLEEAFRLLQTGKQTGKIVLEAGSDDLVPIIPAKVKTMKFRENATYILSGGTGGLGRSLGQWMVKNGARNIVFLSRSGNKKAEAQKTLAELRKIGAKAEAFSCDISNKEAVADTLKQISQDFPPVKGLIQGAMVLQDTIYPNMTFEQWRGAVGPKVQGSQNLDTLLPKDLDFFVMLSSSAGVAGSRGQSNYAAGNTYQDALAQHRRAQGQHGSVIDLGVVLDVGYVAENTSQEVQDNTKKWSFVALREKEVHALVQAAITGESIKGQQVPTQIITGLGTGGMANLAGFQIPWWFSDAKFAHLRDIDTHQVTLAAEEDTLRLQTLLAQATSFDGAADVVSIALVQKLSKALMVDVEDIETTKPLSRYGVDSLLAVEVRTWIFTELQADISVFQLLSNVPLSQLARDITVKSKAVPAAIQQAEGGAA